MAVGCLHYAVLRVRPGADIGGQRKLIPGYAQNISAKTFYTQLIVIKYFQVICRLLTIQPRTVLKF